jgi:hypothetical protein
MYDPNIDQLWVELEKIAKERGYLEDREHDAIILALREDRPWSWIAEHLQLPSAEAAQRRYQQLANRRVGIDDDLLIPTVEEL